MTPITLTELENALHSLKAQHRDAWREFNARTDKILAVLGQRMGCQWNSTEDITEHVTADDIAAAGFSAAEAEALIFVLTEDCMGEPVNSLEMVERYFCYCL